MAIPGLSRFPLYLCSYACVWMNVTCLIIKSARGFCQSWKSYNGFILFFVFMLRWVFGLIMIVLEGNYVRLLCVCGLSCLRNACLKMITCKDHWYYIGVLIDVASQCNEN